MGMTRKSNMSRYWTRSNVTETPFFGKYMSKNSFQLLLSNVHLNDNSQQPRRNSPGFDPLFKIRPFVDLCIDKFRTIYRPNKNLAVDEGGCPWKGRLSFRTYNPQKPNKFNIKLYIISESDSGYISTFDIYCGKYNRFDCSLGAKPIDILCTKTTKTVLGLMERCNLLDKGYNIYMDNYYSSPELFGELYLRDSFACGTVRKNRKGLPCAVTEANLKKGDGVFRRNGPILAIRWCDKRAVYMLSTIHQADMLEVKKWGEPLGKIFKPRAIQEYISRMKAVDLGDQMMSYHCFVRRSLKWYRKLWIHLINMQLLNAYILFKKYSGTKMTNEQFRESIVQSLVEEGMRNCNWTLPAIVCNRTDESPRLFERHFPCYIPGAIGAKRARPSRACYVCSKLPAVDGVKICRKWTSFWCPECKKPLCVDYCFKLYHTVSDYQSVALHYRLDNMAAE